MSHLENSQRLAIALEESRRIDRELQKESLRREAEFEERLVKKLAERDGIA
jgi:hypothetical protein